MRSSALINALSGFWHRFFADLDEVNKLYEGVELLTEQFYVDLLHEVLGAAAADAPLRLPEKLRLWRVREDLFSYEDGDWVVPTPVSWSELPYLQDGLADPRRVLDVRRDFQVTSNAVSFNQNPAELFAFAAKRTSTVECGGVLRVTEFDAVAPGDVVSLEDGRLFKVLFVKPNEIYFSKNTTVSVEESVRWSVRGSGYETGVLAPVRSAQVREWALWAVDSRVDTGLLHRGLGNLYTAPRESTEAYRALVRGITRLFVVGPSIQRLEDGLSAAAGLPIAVRDGERVVQINSGSVTTTDREYPLPGVPVRAGLEVGQVLRAFQPLSEGVRVFDDVSHPNWWLGIKVPKKLLVNVSEEARYASPEMFENKIGARYRGSVGAPNVYVGDVWRQSPAFVLMNKYLKNNVVGVKLHPAVTTQAESIRLVQGLLKDALPPGLTTYLWASTELTDGVAVADTVTSRVVV